MHTHTRMRVRTHTHTQLDQLQPHHTLLHQVLTVKVQMAVGVDPALPYNHVDNRPLYLMVNPYCVQLLTAQGD